MRRSACFVAAFATALSAIPASALAQEGPDPVEQGVCSGGWRTNVYKTQNKHIGTGSIYKNGPGGKMVLTKGHGGSGSVATTITSGGSASIGAIIADVDVKLEGSIEARFEYSWDTTVRYERNITRGKYGNARYGTWGKKAYWEKYYQLPTCKKTQRSTGTADVVTNSEGWKFWETSS